MKQLNKRTTTTFAGLEFLTSQLEVLEKGLLRTPDMTEIHLLDKAGEAVVLRGQDTSVKCFCTH